MGTWRSCWFCRLTGIGEVAVSRYAERPWFGFWLSGRCLHVHFWSVDLIYCPWWIALSIERQGQDRVATHHSELDGIT